MISAFEFVPRCLLVAISFFRTFILLVVSTTNNNYRNKRRIRIGRKKKCLVKIICKSQRERYVSIALGCIVRSRTLLFNQLHPYMEIHTVSLFSRSYNFLVNISSSNMFRSMIRNNVEYGMQRGVVCRVKRLPVLSSYSYWYRYHEPSHHPLLRCSTVYSYVKTNLI